MKILENIVNSIKVHNGIIQEHDIKEDIIVSDTTICVKNAKNLQILYTNDRPATQTITIEIESNNDFELIEQFDYSNDMKILNNYHICENTKVSRFMEQSSSNHIMIEFDDHVKVAKDSEMSVAYVELSTCNIESNYHYELIESGANVSLRLAAFVKDHDKKHYTVSMEHLAPYTTGTMDNYGIVKDEATLIIDGIGTIKKGNHQSSSHQTNKIIVFDPKCSAKANPYLYIDEYDVKASHGASVGKIDEDHLYYLQSRGLAKQDAMHLVTYGYFLPVIEYIKNDELKQQFHDTLREKVGI